MRNGAHFFCRTTKRKKKNNLKISFDFFIIFLEESAHISFQEKDFWIFGSIYDYFILFIVKEFSKNAFPGIRPFSQS